MERKFRLMMIVNIVVIVLLVANFIYSYRSKYKIAYVKSTELVYGYNGMKEANQRLTTETAEYKATVDSLEQGYAMLVADYKSKAASMPENERIKKEDTLRALYQRNENYKAQVQTLIDQKDQQLTEGVLSQINSFIEEYGEKHGYDVIFGTGNGGLVLFGDDGIDITKELLEELNNSYYPESANSNHDVTNEN